MNDATHYWFCIRCERGFLKADCGIYLCGGEQTHTCAYGDCDGTSEDFWEWSRVIKGYVDRYPAVPLFGIVYPLDPFEPGMWVRSRRPPSVCDGEGCQKEVGQGRGWVYRFKSGRQFCIACAQGRQGIYFGHPYVIGFPPIE